MEELPSEPVRREPGGAPRASRPARETGAPKPAEAKPEPSRPEPAPAELPAPTPAASAPGAPRPELRTPETLDEAGAEKQVRDTLERAGRTLHGIDYQSLRREARQQYDTAKQFMEQAEEALKTRNYVAAKYLADKADTIAKGLTGR